MFEQSQVVLLASSKCSNLFPSVFGQFQAMLQSAASAAADSSVLSHLMFEQFQVMLVASSKGNSAAMLLLSQKLGSPGLIQLLPQHPPHCTILPQALLQAQHSCNMTQAQAGLLTDFRQVMVPVPSSYAIAVVGGGFQEAWGC